MAALARPRDGRMIGGVCAALARRFGTSAGTMRVIFLVSCLLPGPQFLLYLADQIEESLDQLMSEADLCHGAFLCKVLNMYSGQLESKHQGLGEKIAEACQEVYVTVRERELI